MSDPGFFAAISGAVSRRSLRARFALSASGLIAIMGLLMLAVVYLAMRYLPYYEASWQPGATTLSAAPSAAAPTDIVQGHAVAAGIVVASESDFVRILLIISGVAVVVIGAVGAAASWLLAGRLLQPLRDLAAVADQARRGSLAHRIGRRGPNDELQTLSDTFDSMLGELERTLARHERFAANASHEIRTPLATTKALLEVARDEEHSPQVAMLISRLTVTNDRLIDTTNALLALATTSDRSLRRESVNLKPLVDDELRLLAAEIRSRDIRVRNGVVASVVNADRELVGLLVGNLVRNAVRHNNDGGYLRIDTYIDDDAVRFIVENSGRVLDTETLAIMSEPFYRATPRTTEPGSVAGHGLGLALASSIVDAHAGSMVFEAIPAGGLRVTVRLPAATRSGT
jgi:two-component system sensor histidine kinase VanS